MTKDIGIHGNLFGGNMLAWIDEAAASMATQVCRTPNMVTVRMSEVVFKKAVKVGFLIRIYGEISAMGRTSVTLKIEARKCNVYSGDESVVCENEITFVRIDEAGEPTPIPESVRSQYQHLIKQ